MTLSELLTKINYLAGKDKRGKTFKITEFNTLLPTVQDKLYSDELAKLVAEDLQAIPPSRLSITPLRVFIEQAGITATNGYVALPDDYVRFVSVGCQYREVDVVTQKEFNSRRTSPFRRPDVRPFCYFIPTNIFVCPTSITGIELQYFRKPTTPYFDYCQDAATLNEVYMPVGSYVGVATDDGTINLYDSTGAILAYSVIKSGSYPIQSQTVELEWEPIYHDHFVMEMLALVGINIDKTELTQYAQSKTNV